MGAINFVTRRNVPPNLGDKSTRVQSKATRDDHSLVERTYCAAETKWASV